MAYDEPNADDIKEPPKKLSAAAKDKILEAAQKRFKFVLSAEKEQRSNETEDLRFQVPELQWSDEARREREGNNNSGGVPIPPRPIVSVDKLAQPCANVVNQARQAHLGIEVHPRSLESNDDTAEMQRGLMRKIDQDSKAPVARMWALDRATKCGRGYYRISTKYDEEGDNPFDQVITVDRILYQENVYFDPTCTAADYSDAKWCFVTSWLTEDDWTTQFKDFKWPGEKMEWDDLQSNAPEWVQSDDQKKVMVAEHWYKNIEMKRIRLLDNGTVLADDGEVPKGRKVIDERMRDVVTLKYCKLSATDVLEEREWDVPMIPIMVVQGKELQPFDGQRRIIGIIRNSREPQRAFNWAFSGAIERAALEPKAPFVGVEGQFEGHEAQWQQANTRNYAYLEYRPVSLGDQPAPPPQRQQVSGTAMSVSIELINIADHALQSTTAQFDPSLGRTNSHEKSGKAIMALQDQASLVTSDYVANLAEITMTYEAKYKLALMPVIYDRPGRVLHILDMEGQTKPVMVNQKYAEGPKGMRALPPMPEGVEPIGNPGEQIKHFDLKRGQYTANVTIGRARDTLRQEANEQLGQIMQENPEMAMVLGPIYYRHQDFPGHNEVAELMLEMREHKFPGLGKKDKGPDPKQLQAQLQQQGEAMKQMDAALKGAAEEIKMKKAEQEGKIHVAQIDADTKIKLAEMENAAKIEAARLQSKYVTFDARMAAIEEALALGQQQQHEAALQAGQQQHEAEMAQMGQQHALEQGEAGHGQALEQAGQAAALAPKPELGEAE